MKKAWSRYWKSSTQPRKQRKYRANAPLHVRRKFVSCALDKVLRKEFGKRSLTARKGDEVVVMRGERKGKIGAILRIDRQKAKIFIDGIKTKKTSGREMDVPIDPSNVKIVKLHAEDVRRKKFIKRRGAQDGKA